VTATAAPSDRSAFEGVRAIVRFNWPFYAAGALALAALLAAFAWLPAGPLVRCAVLVAAAASAWFLAASLAASHWVYDRSDLYRLHWLARALPPAAQHLVSCHAGFDGCSHLLRAACPASTWRVLDHFAPATMTEPSIHRARRWHPPRAGTEPAPLDAWPLADGTADGILAVLAIHELRTERDRVTWFRAAHRALSAGGRIVLVEHLRDLANFAAFGPNFLHFHSRATWQRSWQAAGLRCLDEFRITPFVRVFVLGER
jgi:hypothetical protein